LVAAAKYLVAATKNLFAVPNFVAVITKPFFSVLVIFKGTSMNNYINEELSMRPFHYDCRLFYLQK